MSTFPVLCAYIFSNFVLPAVLISYISQAAAEAVLKDGVPAVSFYGPSTQEVSYVIPDTDADSPATEAALIYAELTTQFITTLWNSGTPFLPGNMTVVVNYLATAHPPPISSLF